MRSSHFGPRSSARSPTTEAPDVVLSLAFSWSTTRILTVYVEHDYRKYGKTTYNFSRLVASTLKMLFAYSIAPLRLSTFTGFGFMLFGIAVLIYAVHTAMVRHTLPGFTFTISFIAVMSGVQLFSLGILGEYLALMYRRGLGRPPYVVRQTVPPSWERGSLGEK